MTCVRLFQFNGEAVTDENPVVIDYEKVNGYKRITKITTFSSYEEALENLQTEGSENRKIVGLYPFISPIPLEAMEDYQMVYMSGGEVEHFDWDLIPEVSPVQFLLPEVKIFEYIGD